MKQFVEAEGRRRIRLLEDVKHRPNRIGDAARKQQGNRSRWNQLQRLPVKNDGPSPSKDKTPVYSARGAFIQQSLTRMPHSANRPHPTDKQDAVHPLHELEAEGWCRSPQSARRSLRGPACAGILLKNGAVVVVVERACTVQGQHRPAKARMETSIRTEKSPVTLFKITKKTVPTAAKITPKKWGVAAHRFARVFKITIHNHPPYIK